LLKINWNETCKHYKIPTNWFMDVGRTNYESIFK
jgi:hypothetical protein